MPKSSSIDWRRELEQVDSLIRAGKAGEGGAKLKKLPVAKLPRPLASEFAGLARRCNEWPLALKLLFPIVHPKVKRAAPVPAAERIEYALALRRAGAIKESQILLADPTLTQEPKAMLARAFGHIGQWNYAAALPELDEYLKVPKLSAYESRVAKVNRLASLAHTGASIEPEFARLEKDLGSESNQLLWANAQEIFAQYQIERGDYKQALERIDAALVALQDEGGPYSLVLRKLRRIAAAMQKKTPQELLAFRTEALASSDWETLRHLDYYMTKLDPECIWAERVYFGTPFRSFREKLEKIRPFNDSAWISNHDRRAAKPFDPWFVGADDGEVTHRLMVLLLQDWYRPISIGGIFDCLYEGAHFDVETSGGRVEKNLSRLKEWLTTSSIPLAIFRSQRQYSLRPVGHTKILMRKQALDFGKASFIFSRYPKDESLDLSSLEWSHKLNKTMRQTVYLLGQGTAEGCIVKKGRGIYTRYAIA